MKASNLCRQFIKSFEKLALVAYPDPASPLGQACVGMRLKLSDYHRVLNWGALSGRPWTIGYGHTKDVNHGMACDEAQADAWFDEELQQFEAAITGMVTVPLSQQQFDALVSFVYNLGSGALKASSLLRFLNNRQYQTAATQFNLWNKAMVNGVLTPLDGLTKRRKAERQIYEDGIYAMHDGDVIDSNDMPDFSDVQSGFSTTA